MCPSVALQWHVASLDFFDAFLDFVGFFLVTVAVPYTKIEMLNASFDMTFDPPSYRLNICLLYTSDAADE